MTAKVGERLELGPEVAAQARRALAPLKAELSKDRFHDAVLLVSELVTNCFRHAGLGRDGVAFLNVEVDRDRVRVEVEDRGKGFVAEPIQTPHREAERGWGLTIVSRIADRWGVRGNGSTVVWFELARD